MTNSMYDAGRARKSALTVARDATLTGRPELATAILAQAPRRWFAAPNKKDANAIDLNPNCGTSGGERTVTMINPTERSYYTNRYHRGYGPYVLQFGAYGWTNLHVYAEGIDDAVEKCAAWLADHAPGHIMEHGSVEHLDLIREAFEDAGLVWTGEIDWQNPAHEQAVQSAEADLTSTESGYLTSYEFSLVLELPDTETLYSFVSGTL